VQQLVVQILRTVLHVLQVTIALKLDSNSLMVSATQAIIVSLELFPQLQLMEQQARFVLKVDTVNLGLELLSCVHQARTTIRQEEDRDTIALLVLQESIVQVLTCQLLPETVMLDIIAPENHKPQPNLLLYLVIILKLDGVSNSRVLQVPMDRLQLSQNVYFVPLVFTAQISE
jgi:hypothetical protein